MWMDELFQYFLWVQGFYLPWAMLALDLIFGAPLMPDILGMVAGHLYYFLTVLHPLAGGKYIFKTPLWVYPCFFLALYSQFFFYYFIEKVCFGIHTREFSTTK